LRELTIYKHNVNAKQIPFIQIEPIWGIYQITHININYDMNKTCISHDLTHITDESAAPDISSYDVTINSGVNNDKALLLMYCDFNPKEGTDYFYQVSWGVSTGLTWTDLLFESQLVQYTSRDEFREETMLTETHMDNKGFNKPGFMVYMIQILI